MVRKLIATSVAAGMLLLDTPAFAHAAKAPMPPAQGQCMCPMGRMHGMSSMDATGSMGMNGMGGLDTKAPLPPPVQGYSQGRGILFIHTEASDPKIAKILSEMMGSPVLTVPSLAKAPKESLADVFVFSNGVKPEGAKGPLGYQPDVLPNPPETEGYSPLRKLNKVTWKNPQNARVLKSAAEIREAQAKGEVTIEPTDVVVNMPMLTWPGGKR